METKEKKITRFDLIQGIRETIREMFGMPEDEILDEGIRFYEDLGFDSLEYPSLTSGVIIKYGLSFQIIDDCQEKPNTIGDLADAILLRVPDFAD